jgi:peroxiredoxin Q/BCP
MRRLGAGLALLVAVGCIPRTPAPPPVTAAPEALLAEGSAVPDVAGIGTDDRPIPLSRFRGKLLVVYFYPLDYASGASAEAEEFRADYARYRKLGAAVVGVSTDEPRVHKEFAAAYKLPFPLLSDRGGEVARAFGVPLTGGATRHATFVVDRTGVVRKVWPRVRPWGHSAEVLAAIRALR